LREMSLRHFFQKGRSLPMPYTMKLFTAVILAIS
jgi:hypothetical protein